MSKKKIAATLIAGLLLLPGITVASPSAETVIEANGKLLSAMPNRAQESKRIILPSAIQAAELYGFGLQHRNASIQYSILSKAYKKVMYPIFNELNWVTGVSSPWITSYKVIKETVVNPNSEIIELRLDMATSNGPEQPTVLKLSLVRERDSWVITEVA